MDPSQYLISSPHSSKCTVAVKGAPAGTNVLVMGQPFLRIAVTVVNMDTKQIGFASSKYADAAKHADLPTSSSKLTLNSVLALLIMIFSYVMPL